MTIPHIPEGADEYRASPNMGTADDGNTLIGHAAVFNQDTLIDSFEGKFVERIAPGAFTKTLKQRGDKIKVLFNHGHDPSIGEMPLGKARVIEQDEIGLRVEVPLADTDFNRERIRPLLRDGALDGMSFRFSVPVGGDVWDDEGDVPVRTVTEAKLFEFGPVTFPAYDSTDVGLRADPRLEAFVRTEFPHETIDLVEDVAEARDTPDTETVTEPREHSEPLEEVAEPREHSAPDEPRKHSSDHEDRIAQLTEREQWRLGLIEMVRDVGNDR